MPEKCKNCCSRLFCMSAAEVNGEDFEAMANKKDCRKRVFTNADRIRAMSDEELAELFDGIVDNGRSCSLICGDLNECKRNNSIERICKNHYLKWLKQPAEGE